MALKIEEPLILIDLALSIVLLFALRYYTNISMGYIIFIEFSLLITIKHIRNKFVLLILAYILPLVLLAIFLT